MLLLRSLAIAALPLTSSGDASASDAESTVLVRMAKGADAQLHNHPGGEETYMVSGKLRVGDHLLGAGDYLWTPPGVAHDGHAEEDAVFFVVLPAGLRVQIT
jgi:quercetin dioxygenase-like cupin family protein